MNQKLAIRFKTEINELAAASRRLGEQRFVCSHGGNLSWRVADNLVLITPTKVTKRTLQPADICAVDLTGAVVFAGPGRRPTGETPMHLRFYEKRPDVRSVVHAHPPILTGFALSGRGDLLRQPLLPEPVLEAGPVLTIRYAEPISDALAAEFDRVIHLSNAFLMTHHGVTVCGAHDVGRTLDILEMLEMEAYSVWVAATLGRVSAIPLSDVADLERTLSTRKLPRPGDPRHVKSLVQQYRRRESGKRLKDQQTHQEKPSDES
jgi:L-fuculose-phosphate aldolase